VELPLAPRFTGAFDRTLTQENGSAETRETDPHSVS
jgi:hypothetical protein